MSGEQKPVTVNLTLDHAVTDHTACGWAIGGVFIDAGEKHHPLHDGQWQPRDGRARLAEPPELDTG